MTIHGRFGVAVVLVAVVGVLLVLLARVKPASIPTVRVYVRLCALAAGAEAAIGLVLLITGHRPTEAIHLFYGAATVIPIPAAELLARRVRPGAEVTYLLAGVAATALFGLRAVTTGSM
jgi:hypothetical protein